MSRWRTLLSSMVKWDCGTTLNYVLLSPKPMLPEYFNGNATYRASLHFPTLGCSCRGLALLAGQIPPSSALPPVRWRPYHPSAPRIARLTHQVLANSLPDSRLSSRSRSIRLPLPLAEVYAADELHTDDLQVTP
jgi:hypothetical protein